MDALFGGILGGILRLAPELLGWLDRKNERRHELKMFDRQLEADRLKSESAIREAQAKGDIQVDLSGLQALIESIKAQGQLTGNKFVDGANALVRPFLTYWWAVILTTAVFIAQFMLLLETTPPAEAILKLWGPDEKTIVAGMINFWFLDRVIRHRKGA